MERNERTSGLIVIVFVLLLLTVGCGDNRINPASVTGPNTTTITMKDGDIAYLKKHNAINGVTHRLKGPVIKVYDETGLAQPYLNKWGRIIGLTFVSGPKGSGLDILIDNSILNCGLTNAIRGPIKVRTTSCDSPGIGTILDHEIGHLVGFKGHTTDGGLMDISSPSDLITAPVASMLRLVYSYPDGTPVA